MFVILQGDQLRKKIIINNPILIKCPVSIAILIWLFIRVWENIHLIQLFGETAYWNICIYNGFYENITNTYNMISVFRWNTPRPTRKCWDRQFQASDKVCSDLCWGGEGFISTILKKNVTTRSTSCPILACYHHLWGTAARYEFCSCFWSGARSRNGFFPTNNWKVGFKLSFSLT